MNHTLEVLTADRDYHQELLKTYKNELVNLPEGRLQYRMQGGKVYVYRRINKAKKKNKCNIPNGSLGFAESRDPDKQTDVKELIKRKFFILKSLPILENNIKVLDRCLKSYIVYDEDSVCSSLGKAYESIPMSRAFYMKNNEYSRLWHEFQSNQNTYYDIELKHKLNGSKVRSKSEAVIHTLLDKYNIPFKYEACLDLGKIKFYPDFLILDHINQKIIIWEHFGMINDKSYVERMENKLATYRANGITLWDNLIITFDKENGSLDIAQIEKIIKLFLVA